MGSFVQVSKVNELEKGSMREVSAEGRKFLLARVGDKYYAADINCPHMGGNLAKGKLEGPVIECPLHGSQFDLGDGSVVRWLKCLTKALAFKRPKKINTYKVKIEGDKILIEI